MRLKSFSRQKQRSMTLRPLYARLLKRWRAILLDLFGITGFAPRLTMSARKIVAVIPLVSDERRHRRGKRKKGRRGGNICVLAGSEMKCARSAIGVAQRVNFRGASAA